MTSQAPPIVILGVSRRSGTNFLGRLLECHADCASPADPLREDHLLRDAPRLVRYARAASRRWPRRWGDRQRARDDLLRHLGGGLLGFLQDSTGDARVVTKTPSPQHIDLYPRLFPQAYVLLLVRDGRSVTESLVRGFGFSYERAMREWRAGARRIVAFQRAVPEPQRVGLRVAVVRYERLVGSFDEEMARLLRFLDLDPDRFDREAARRLPVYGSSFVRTAAGELTWKPVERTASFDPSRRYASWGRFRHGRFAWRAGRYQRALGYTTEAPGGVLWSAVNVVMDLARPVVLARDALVVAVRRWRRMTRSGDAVPRRGRAPGGAEQPRGTGVP